MADQPPSELASISLTSNPSVIASASAQIPKRRRIDVACNGCRQRKSRCDGTRPNCAPCTRLQLQCVYEPISAEETSKPHGRKLTYDELIRKVKDLEAQLHARDELGERMNGVPMPATDEPIEGLPLDNEAAVDELATQVFNEIPERNIGHFGSASNHAFFRTISSAFAYQIPLMVQNQDVQGQVASRYSLTHASRSPSPSPCREVNQRLKSYTDAHRATVDPYALPPEHKISMLVDYFFATVGPVFPYVEKSTMAAVEPVWRTTRSGRALLNIICAHASLVSDATAAEAFYDRTVALLDAGTIHGASLELIQAFLLLCSFQQSTQRSTASWTYHALAIKSAIQHGLHSAASYEEHGAQTAEVRTRIWFAIINQDRLLSTSFGRPCLIQANDIHVSLPSDSSLPADCTSASAKHHSEGLTYFNCVTTLYALRYEAVASLYNHNIGQMSNIPAEDLIVSRLRLACQLERWCESCVSHFDMPTSAEVMTWSALTCHSNRFRLLLSIQYHCVALLLNAPVIANILERGQSETRSIGRIAPLLESIASTIAHDFHAATEIHKLVTHLVHYAPDFMLSNAAWWLCNFNSFTASLHLFAIMLILQRGDPPVSVSAVSLQVAREALDFGLQTLGTVGRVSLMSRRGRHALQKFLHVFDSLTTPQPPTHQDQLSGELNLTAPTNIGFDDYYTQLVSQSTADFFTPHSSGFDFIDADFGLNILNFT